MGMSSSQARLLTLTARMHDIEYRAQRLEAQKLQMANESRRAYESYLEALDATKIQYKGINCDGSITFRDATLRTLENGAIPGYGGEASYKPFLLKNGMTDEIYVTPEFAAAFGIVDNSELPPLGTLEQWLEEYPGLTRTGSYIENRITPPGDIHPEYTNNITGPVSAPDMLKHIYTGIPEFNTINTNQYYGWKMSSLNGGSLPTNWKDANNYWGYINISGAYYNAKNNSGIAKVGNCDHKSPYDSTTLTYDFELSNQYNAYAYSFLKGLATGYVEETVSFAELISNVPTYTREGDDTEWGTYSQQYMIGSGHYTGIYGFDGTDESKANAKTFATFLFHAMQTMGYILDEYGTEYATNPTAKGIVDDFWNNVMSKLETRKTDDSPQDLYDALIQFCSTHTKKDGTPFASITDGKFDIEKKSCICVCESNGCTSQGAKQRMFQSEGSAKTYGVVDYSKNDIKTLIKIGIMDAGLTEDEANTKINSLLSDPNKADWILYSIINNYTDETTWATCINKIIDGSYSAGDKPTRFVLDANATDKIIQEETETVSNLNDADTLNFGYTRDSYNETVLYDICNSNNRLNKNTYSDFVSSLTDVEMASLIALKFNDTSTYNNIIQAIIDADGDPDALNTIKAALQSCAGKTIHWGTNSVEFNQTSETVGKGKIEIPKLETLASNIYVAMRQNNIDANESEILAYLISNYSEENPNNNYILTYINDLVCGTYDYAHGGDGLIATLGNIAAGVAIDHADVPISYINCHLFGDYDTTRNLTGRATEDWVHDEAYYRAVDEYNARKALEGNKFRIIRDEDLLNSTEFVSNWLTLNEGYLLEFDPETMEMKDTNVSVETHLQEVSDERNLKKAEAQYEADMRRIDQKDRRYDTQLAALDTERNAIKQEMETVKTVARDNVDRTFKLFS